MPDCTITEIRDLLPEFERGTLDERERALVGVHVASCAACARELQLLAMARRTLSQAPAVDVQRIAAALPKPPAASRPSLRVERGAGTAAPATPLRPARAWSGVPMRIAAALAVMAVGGMGLRIALGGDTVAGTPARVPAASTTTRATTPASSAAPAPAASQVASAAGPAAAAPARAAATTTTSAHGVSFGGGLSDLSDGDLQSLLGDLEALDGLPSAEPEPAVTPVTTGAI